MLTSLFRELIASYFRRQQDVRVITHFVVVQNSVGVYPVASCTSLAEAKQHLDWKLIQYRTIGFTMLAQDEWSANLEKTLPQYGVNIRLRVGIEQTPPFVTTGSSFN